MRLNSALAFIVLISVFSLSFLNVASQEDDDAEGATCVTKGSIRIDSENSSVTLETLGKLNLTVAGLEYFPGENNPGFRVFVADSEDVYREKNDTPSVAIPEYIRLFFENGKDLYVFYILENNKIEGKHFYLDKSGDTPSLKELLKATVDVKLNETCRNNCIFGHSTYGFYYSASPSLCEPILNVSQFAPTSTNNCTCGEDKYCVYDPAKDRNEPTQYNHARIRNAVMCNLIVENDTTILIEEAVTDNPVACFAKDKTLQQVQFWKVGWKEYNCCRSLVGETAGGDSCQKEKIVTPEPDEELGDKCVIKGNIDIDPKYRSGTRWTLGELKLTIAGLEYLPEAKKFRVFVADSKYVYKEPTNSGTPSVTKPDNIRLFFENGKDLYVFYILEDKKIEGKHFYLDRSGDTAVLKPSDLKNSVSVKLSETTCRNKCIFGHSAYGFYYSPSPSSCVSLLNTTSTKNCTCAEDKYCVYDPAKDRNEPTQYSHARIRNSVMCNLIVEQNTTIFIEDIADNPLSCFTKSKTLHQVQFWKDGWKEYNCCRSLVGDTSGSDSCQIDPKKNPTSKRTFPPKPDKRVSSTTTESDIEPVNPPNVEYFIVTPSSSRNLLNHVYHGALMVICVASCVMFRELWD